MSRHDTLYSIFTTQSTRWISEQLRSISLWGFFFFFLKLHLFSIYFWAEHCPSPPSKPSSQDRNKLTQLLIKFQIIKEQDQNLNAQTSLEQACFMWKVREKGKSEGETSRSVSTYEKSDSSS